MTTRSRSRPLLERFWEKVKKTSGCWIWTGSRTGVAGGGYGKIWVGNGRRLEGAHRLSYELRTGKRLRSDQYVMHMCDNPPCVRPSHLFAGTQRQNLADMTSKGRRRNGCRSGEDCNKAKLSRVKVDRIRILYEGGLTQSAIAKKYNVHQSTVGRIIRGEYWRNTTYTKIVLTKRHPFHGPMSRSERRKVVRMMLDEAKKAAGGRR